VGREAALLRWQASILLVMNFALTFIWIPCVIAGLKLASAPLVAAGVVLGSVAFGGWVLAGIKLRASNRAASRCLGLKLGFLRIAPPPRTTKHYEAWCRQYGIAPYQADKMARE
jgi:hypothetical protein